MPRAGTAARKREREGLPPTKPGPRGWVFGSKKKLLEAHKEEFLSAAEMKTTGSFYKRVGHLYIKKYGWDMPWNKDRPIDEEADEDDEEASEASPDSEDDVDVDADDVDARKVAPDVAEAHAEYFVKLCKKIGVWYNTEYGSAMAKKSKAIPFTKLFDRAELEPPVPVKTRVLHYYSHHFYAERVRPQVAARWAAMSRRENPPKMITVRNLVTREAWLAEPQAFRDEVTAALEKEHKTALEAYSIAVSSKVPATAEEYNIALNNAAYYLQPFTDAIHERFGMNVSLLLCGPIPDRGGRIEVRSVHSGMSNGLMPRIWSDFDRGGFDFAQRSLVDFTHHCFTDEECRARAVKTAPAESDVGDGTAAATDVEGTPPPSPVTEEATPMPPTATKGAPGVTATQAPLDLPDQRRIIPGEFTFTAEELAMLAPEGLAGEAFGAAEGLTAEALERMLFDPSAFNEDGSLRHGLGEGEAVFGEDGNDGFLRLDDHGCLNGAMIQPPMLHEDPHTQGEQQPLVIREALRAKLDKMEPAAGEGYMTVLRGMSVQAREWENEFADHSPPFCTPSWPPQTPLPPSS
ncbi:hypothetical protein C8F04DRAFT_1265536 [Mycena alexandri]|uniref:Uncharacterized protein n=1 Tax=Mycena alexandri TaxID=1745969 RepID=A0AAD6SJP7_9AGAR|nr:hypothetical protein C8F04DRAFT_1265536 [Mycena alexandri]